MHSKVEVYIYISIYTSVVACYLQTGATKIAAQLEEERKALLNATCESGMDPTSCGFRSDLGDLVALDNWLSRA
jgi:hypothetical protein